MIFKVHEQNFGVHRSVVHQVVLFLVPQTYRGCLNNTVSAEQFLCTELGEEQY